MIGCCSVTFGSEKSQNSFLQLRLYIFGVYGRGILRGRIRIERTGLVFSEPGYGRSGLRPHVLRPHGLHRAVGTSRDGRGRAAEEEAFQSAAERVGPDEDAVGVPASRLFNQNVFRISGVKM